MEKFEVLYKRLNTKQKEAVDTIEGPVMVIAGPGTGKTTILTLRIANILKCTDTPPHGILAITYTDAGVKAMREKLKEVIGGRAHEVAIHTFHSFAAAMMAEYPDHFLHIADLRLMTDVEQESLIRSILNDPRYADLRPLGKPDAYMSAILRGVDDAKREALTPDMVRAHAKKAMEAIKADEASISTRGASKGQLKADALSEIEKCERTLLFADVYEAYEAGKRAAKQKDFNDLITELLVALRNDRLLLRLIQERFLYILVDEHQDTNDAQNLIVALVAEFFETPNIFIVGDEKQAIYRFQGASVENFLLLERRWPSVKVISLDTNYRSHQGILDASFAMIENNYEGDEHRNLRLPLVSGRKEPTEPVEIVTGENVSAIEKHLVERIREITSSEPDATVAIITRRNRDVERVIHLLESHDIPVSSERSVDIFNHSVGSLFFDLIDYISDPTHVDALARTLVAGMWGVSFQDAVDISRQIRSGAKIDLDRRLPALHMVREELVGDGPLGFIIHAAEESGFSSIVARDPVYVHVWRGIVTLVESLVRETRVADPLKLIQALLAYRLSSESKTVKVSVGAPDLPVRAMTAHGSKGLEFDYVFLPYATEESWVGRTRGSSFVLPRKRVADSDIRDTRRLFYVALTRARRHATILTAMQEADGKALSPLRFIGELAVSSTEAVSLPRANIEDVRQSAKRHGMVVHQSAIVDLAKQTLMTSGLSVTALNHFLECPTTFLYESILKLPQAPSVSAEKGSAMHMAMDRIWRESDRNSAHIEQVMSAAVSEYLDQSFLPMSDKEAVRKELFADMSAVAKALEGHLSAKGPIFTERWVKSSFDSVYGNEKIPIIIHGKLDAIIEDGDRVEVFDYKTRQAMSVAEIKGETKNSNGNYFRQLVFYRLLLEGEPRWKSRHIVPALVFVSPDKKGRCPIVSVPIEDKDVKAVQDNIQAVIDSVWSGKISDSRCDDEKCRWCGFKRIV